MVDPFLQIGLITAKKGNIKHRMKFVLNRLTITEWQFNDAKVENGRESGRDYLGKIQQSC